MGFVVRIFLTFQTDLCAFFLLSQTRLSITTHWTTAFRLERKTSFRLVTISTVVLVSSQGASETWLDCSTTYTYSCKAWTASRTSKQHNTFFSSNSHVDKFHSIFCGAGSMVLLCGTWYCSKRSLVLSGAWARRNKWMWLCQKQR